jgi:holo-[acyl-carrier protein] synthase
MIIGIGVDIVQIKRVREVLDRNGDAFLRRVLTEREWEQLRQRRSRIAETVAGRFSAKEACSKALGTGIGEALSFHDMEILSDELGRPHLSLSQGALQRFRLPNNVNVQLSISHTDTEAISYVIVEVL